MSENWEMPPERDFGFYQKRKHNKWRAVDAPVPALEAPVADTHAHLHMLPDPAWELARCAANGVGLVCEICDPAEYGIEPLTSIDAWLAHAAGEAAGANAAALPGAGSEALLEAAAEVTAEEGTEADAFALPEARPAVGASAMPEVCAAVGVHPHNAKLYTPEVEAELVGALGDSRVVTVGEIGLDYYYDISPRDVQRRVFVRQLEIAKEHGLPVALHLRSAADPAEGYAHGEALEILREVGFPEAGTLLHCCSLPEDELRPWVDAGCYIAYGGALTFKKSDAAREAVRIVPEDRLLLETDAPYMAPEPMRGTTCTPAHVIFTAACLAAARGVEPGEPRRAFLERLYGNTRAFFRL